MITIKTYKDYRDVMKAFKRKKLNLLTIVSRGGLGKTFISEEELMDEAPLIFTGHVTPLSLYKTVYTRSQEEKEFIIIFDDVDTLMSNATNVSLLKQICDTRETKIVKYFTTSPMIGTIPHEFETNCKVLMLMNNLKPDDTNLQALMTRSHLMHFIPEDIEVLNNIKTFANDKIILDFIEIYASFSNSLNLRCYKRAEELKRAGLNWQSSIINDLKVDPDLLEIHKLLTKYKTNTEREKHFKGSRMTFYRKLKILVSKNQQLRNKFNIGRVK